MKLSLIEKVERLILAEIPEAEFYTNEEAGTIIIQEWHGDLDPPTYIVPQHAALEFARWLATKRCALRIEAHKEARRLTTPDDKKRINRAYRAWRKRYPDPTAPIAADARAPGGKNTYKDMIAALHTVQAKQGRDECFRILTESGKGAKSVRDVHPDCYDAVTEAAIQIAA